MGLETLIQVKPDVRVEQGLARKMRKVTKEDLDRIAQSGRPFDSAGKLIGKVGSDMEFLDRHGPRVWYVYKLDKPEAEGGRYIPQGVHPDKDAALAQAGGL